AIPALIPGRRVRSPGTPLLHDPQRGLGRAVDRGLSASHPDDVGQDLACTPCVEPAEGELRVLRIAAALVADHLHFSGEPNRGRRRSSKQDVGNLKPRARDTTHRRVPKLRSRTAMRHLVLDLRSAARILAKAPIFTAVALLSLALGIGANTAIFTLLDQILLRLLPVKNPDELVLLTWRGSHYGSNTGGNALSYPMYKDFRDRNQVFSGLMCRYGLELNLGYGGSTERVAGELVSGNYFEVLGVTPALGRTITPDDRRARWVNVFGRLKPGVTAARAKASLQPLFHSILEMEVKEKEFARATPYTKEQFLRSWMDVLLASRGRWFLRQQAAAPLRVLMAI